MADIQYSIHCIASKYSRSRMNGAYSIDYADNASTDTTTANPSSDTTKTNTSDTSVTTPSNNTSSDTTNTNVSTDTSTSETTLTPPTAPSEENKADSKLLFSPEVQSQIDNNNAKIADYESKKEKLNTILQNWQTNLPKIINASTQTEFQNACKNVINISSWSRLNWTLQKRYAINQLNKKISQYNSEIKACDNNIKKLYAENQALENPNAAITV